MSSFTQSYRTFLKAGYAAVGRRSQDQQAIRDRIRHRFEQSCGDIVDPVKSMSLTLWGVYVREDLSLYVGENTLQMLINASQHRGVERAVVRNICRLHALEKEYTVR